MLHHPPLSMSCSTSPLCPCHAPPSPSVQVEGLQTCSVASANCANNNAVEAKEGAMHKSQVDRTSYSQYLAQSSQSQPNGTTSLPMLGQEEGKEEGGMVIMNKLNKFLR